jgi:hypothetical protein
VLKNPKLSISGFDGGLGLGGENVVYQQRHTQKQAPAQKVSP